MSCIARYVTWELLKVFAAVLAALVLLLLLAGLAQEALRRGLPPGAIVRLVPYVAPKALSLAVPATVLFAVCAVYGRMAADNELLALKSAGVSPLAAVQPGLVLSLAVSVAATGLTEAAYTWGYWGAQRVIVESAADIALSVLRVQRSYRTGGLSIAVERVEGDRLVRPTIVLHQSGEKAPTTITAEEAELEVDAAARKLTFRLTNGRVEVGDHATLRFPDTVEQSAPLDMESPNVRLANPAHLRQDQIPAERRRQTLRIRDEEQTLAALAALDLASGGFARPDSGRQWSKRLERLAKQRERLHRLETEPHRRWASGLSCLCFAAVGIPLAIRLRTADYMTAFGACFLPILIGYYPLFAFGLDRAKQGALPPYAVWAGNVACLAAGAWLMRKVIRH